VPWFVASCVRAERLGDSFSSSSSGAPPTLITWTPRVSEVGKAVGVGESPADPRKRACTELKSTEK